MPVAHGAGLVGVEPAAADEPAQHALADAGLNGSDISLAERGQLADTQRPIVEEEQGVDDAAVKMDVLVERIAEAVDEADGAETGVGRRIGAALESGASSSSFSIMNAIRASQLSKQR